MCVNLQPALVHAYHSGTSFTVCYNMRRRFVGPAFALMLKFVGGLTALDLIDYDYKRY